MQGEGRSQVLEVRLGAGRVCVRHTKIGIVCRANRLRTWRARRGRGAWGPQYGHH